MARYTGPKDRLSRREGVDIFGKGAKLTRINIPPGVHGGKRTRMPSNYGKQLREKQKVKRIYGVMERQFSNYVKTAMKSKGNTGEKLLSLLERRLDNAIYRLGFVPTRPAGRQIITHRHVLVNGKILNIPSYKVKKGDTITLSAKGMAVPSVKKKLEEKKYKVPSWLKRKGAAGKAESDPMIDDVSEPISSQDVIEFYSR